jgi:hypothetical protein
MDGFQQCHPLKAFTGFFGGRRGQNSPKYCVHHNEFQRKMLYVHFYLFEKNDKNTRILTEMPK